MAEEEVTHRYPVRAVISSMDHQVTIRRPFHPDHPLLAREAAIPITFHRPALATIHSRVDLKAQVVHSISTGLQVLHHLLVRLTRVQAVSVRAREDHQDLIHLKDIQDFPVQAVHNLVLVLMDPALVILVSSAVIQVMAGQWVQA